MGGFAAMAVPAALGLLSSRSASKAQREANRPQPYNETTSRTPWAEGAPYIQDVLRQAQSLYGREPWQQLPSAWDRMLTPEQRAVQNPPAGRGGATGPGSTPGQPGGGELTWRGKDKAQVRAAKEARQNARTAARQQPPAEPAEQGAPAGGMAGMMLNQQGFFGAPRQLQQEMYGLLRGGGTPSAQAGNAYVQQLLGGGTVNPLVSQLWNRLAAWQPIGARGGGAAGGG